jgi:hypothetical protein
MAPILKDQARKSTYIYLPFIFGQVWRIIEREGGLFVGPSDVLLKAKSLLFV